MNVKITISPQLQKSIDRLYLAFSKYELRKNINYCTCGCIEPAEVPKIYAQPLGKLSGENLSLFAQKTMTTWGDEYDFRHFLPRLFELSIKDPYGGHYIDLWLICWKLAYGDWKNWDSPEQAAIQNHFMVLWDELIAEYDPDRGYSLAIFFIDNLIDAHEDTSKYLTFWQNRLGFSEIQNLHSYIDEFLQSRTDKLPKFGPAEEEKQRLQVIEHSKLNIKKWLVSHELSQKLSEQITPTDSEKNTLVSETLEKIELIKIYEN